MKRIFSSLALGAAILFFAIGANAQCLQLIHCPADTVGWIEGSDNPDSYKRAFYNNDTFVINTSTGGENNYIYNSFPTTLYGTASTFSASFDFRIDSNNSCSDGLTFWFFTSSLYEIGSTSHEGGDLGFPDTTIGYALAFRTIGCVDEIYMKKINSTSYNWSGGSGPDTNICTPLYSQMFLTDSQWHHCIVNYDHGNITTSFDGGAVVMTGYSPILGTGHFGFMATNGGGYSRKCLKNIQICAGLGTPTVGSDSFGMYVNRLCNGPQITVQTNTYSSAYNVITYYGDGTHDSTGFAPAMTGGYAVISHTYQTPGNYTIKQFLYNGTTKIDSLHEDYENIFCATLPVKFYVDANGDCLKESGETYLTQTVKTEIDSNGIPIDTISATSGFYYNAHGGIGTIYSFRVIDAPSNLLINCPATGIVYDSLVPGIFIYPIRYFGLNCGTGSSFDLSVHAVVPVTGVHDEWGNIYVENYACLPTDATVTLTYSPKYSGTPDQITPPATSVSGNTIVWNLSALSSTLSTTANLHYSLWYSGIPLTIGDTVQSYYCVTPYIGDTDTINNTQVIIDTIRAGCDPNEMWVSPSCMDTSTAGAPIQYIINFENTGNDTAHNIYVMDTLSDFIDPYTMNIEMSSHEMYVYKYKDDANQNILKFDFPNINLLDSSHHGFCDGAVVFNIKSKPALAVGSSIVNRAGIYFDVNGVVMTNPVTTQIGGCTTTKVNQVNKAATISLYPNPATNQLIIKTDNTLYSSCTITNVMGQAVLQQNLTTAQTVVNIATLPTGVYYVIFMSANGNEVRKFVKM